MRPTSEQLVLDYHAKGTAELESSQHGNVSLCEESRYRGGGADHNCASGPNSFLLTEQAMPLECCTRLALATIPFLVRGKRL